MGFGLREREVAVQSRPWSQINQIRFGNGPDRLVLNFQELSAILEFDTGAILFVHYRSHNHSQEPQHVAPTIAPARYPY